MTEDIAISLAFGILFLSGPLIYAVERVVCSLFRMFRKQPSSYEIMRHYRQSTHSSARDLGNVASCYCCVSPKDIED